MAREYKVTFFNASYDVMREKRRVYRNDQDALAAEINFGLDHNKRCDWESERYAHVMVETVGLKRNRVQAHSF